MIADHAAHASLIVVAGCKYRVRREFDLVRRIEERFGPLLGLGERMEKHQFTMAELVELYRLVLAGQPEPPDDATLQEHAVRIGIVRANAELYQIATAFFMGEERFMKSVADQMKASPPDPRMALAGWPGANSTGQPRGSDGRPPISGERPSTN